jgi:hypothetical protein
MIYDYNTFEEMCWERFTGKCSRTYQDFLLSVYGPDYKNTAPLSALQPPKKYASSQFETTYETS